MQMKGAVWREIVVASVQVGLYVSELGWHVCRDRRAVDNIRCVISKTSLFADNIHNNEFGSSTRRATNKNEQNMKDSMTSST